MLNKLKTKDGKNVLRKPRVNADGTVDKSQYNVSRDIDKPIGIGSMTASMINARNQEKANERRAIQRDKVKSMLESKKTSTRTTSPRVGAASYSDPVEKAREEKEALRKGNKYY